MTMSAAALSIVLKAIDEASGVFRDVAGEADKASKGIAGGADVAAVALGGVMLAAGSLAVALGGVALNAAMSLGQAQNDLQAKLGLTAEAAAELGQTVKNVYGDNFGDSIEDVSAAVATVHQQLGNLPADQLNASLETITENAFRLKHTFGVEVGESVSAVRTLMENFGLTSEEAFNFITAGMQQGLDRSGDFLDTIGEYATQFKNGGADAGQFFSLLESGLQGGMLGTDKAADAFKEFRVRIQDGSKTTAEGLKALGINADELAQQMASGQVTAADAFELVIGKLRETGDANVVMQAGVALLGTQFEDLGTDAALALSLAGTSMDDLAGRTSGLDVQYQNLGAVIRAAWRAVELALVPVGDLLLAIANRMAADLPVAIALVQGAIGPFVEFVIAGFGLVGVALGVLQQGFDALVAFLAPKMGEAVAAVQAFMGSLDPNLTAAVQNVMAFITAVVGELVAFWQENWGSIEAVLTGVWAVIEAAVKQAWNVVSTVITVGLALLAGDWEGAWDAIKAFVETTFANISQAVEGALTALLGVFGIGLAALGVDWEAAWDGIKDFASSTWDSITSTARGAVNAIIGFINGMIAGWNALNFSVPAIEVLGTTFGGFSVGVPQIPNIPLLARGGHVLGSGLAVVGERGPELVSLPRGATVAPLGSGMGVTVIIQGNVYGDADFEQKVAAAWTRVARRGGFGFAGV